MLGRRHEERTGGGKIWEDSSACLFPFSVERLSFHLYLCTGVCRHMKASKQNVRVQRFTYLRLGVPVPDCLSGLTD